MRRKSFDNSSDVYISLKDNLEHCSSAFISTVSKQVMDVARFVDQIGSGFDRDSSACYISLLFDQRNLGECQVLLGEKNPVCVELSLSDIRYLAASETELNRLVALRIGENLVSKTIKVGAVWIDEAIPARQAAIRIA